jgi:hypothetical protein
MRTALFGGYLWALWHIGVLRPQEKHRIVTVLRSPGSALRSVMN